MIGLAPSKFSSSRTAVTAGLVLLGLCTYAIPQFVRMPQTNDAQMYDLQVRLLAEGGVLYRDILEPNLPGVVWIQSLVRHIGGWTSEALRVFDLLVFAIVVYLIERWFARGEWSAASRLWLVTALVGFYVSLSEWCHCQRDSWLLLPALGALTVRQTVIRRQQGTDGPPRSLWLLSIGEGLLWGCGVWLKPHIVLPAILVWTMGTVIARPGKRALVDIAGLVLGGLIVGLLGIAWMIQHGCWPAFWETVRQWNPRYVAAGREHWSVLRFLGMSLRLSPWMLLHGPAAVIAIRALHGAFLGEVKDQRHLNHVLLSAFYLGWSSQAFFLQHLFDYIHAPVILLAILVVATPIQEHFSKRWCRALVGGFAVLAILASPLASVERAGSWWTCLITRANPELYDRLAVLQNPHWQDLDRVADFLAQQDPGKKDVCCYHSDLVSLYNRLNLLPPTKFVYVHELSVYFFPDRGGDIAEALQQSPHRYIVTDMMSAQLTPEQSKTLLSPAYQSAMQQPSKKPRLYPWGYPVVFQSGTYLVHRVSK